MVIRISVPMKTVSANRLLRAHWKARQFGSASQGIPSAKNQAETVAAYLMAHPDYLRIAGKPTRVRLTRLAPRILDGDNAQIALKAVRDGVARCLRFDDGDREVTWEYAQIQSKHSLVTVEIEWPEKGFIRPVDDAFGTERTTIPPPGKRRYERT